MLTQPFISTKSKRQRFTSADAEYRRLDLLYLNAGKDLEEIVIRPILLRKAHAM